MFTNISVVQQKSHRVDGVLNDMNFVKMLISISEEYVLLLPITSYDFFTVVFTEVQPVDGTISLKPNITATSASNIFTGGLYSNALHSLEIFEIFCRENALVCQIIIEILMQTNVNLILIKVQTNANLIFKLL